MGFSKYRYVFKNANFINNKAQVQKFYKKTHFLAFWGFFTCMQKSPDLKKGKSFCPT